MADGWGKQVNNLHEFLQSKSQEMRRSVEPGSQDALADFMNQVPELMQSIRDLERLQHTKLHAINQERASWKAKKESKQQQFNAQQSNLNKQYAVFDQLKTYNNREIANANAQSKPLQVEKDSMQTLISQLEKEAQEDKATIYELTTANEDLQQSRNRAEAKMGIAQMLLESAKNTINLLSSAWEDNQGLIVKNNDLQTIVDDCMENHGDVDDIREEVIRLQPRKIGEEAAIRLPATMIAEIEGLSQARLAAQGLMEEEREARLNAQGQIEEERQARLTADGDVEKLRRELDHVREDAEVTEEQVKRLQGLPQRCQCQASSHEPSPEIPAAVVQSPVTMNTSVARMRKIPLPLSILSILSRDISDFASDVLPQEVVDRLRERFAAWQTRSRFWNQPQSPTEEHRTCLEVWMGRKKSDWANGTEYACRGCERKNNLCVVVVSNEELWLLARKQGVEEGRTLSERGYWLS